MWHWLSAFSAGRRKRADEELDEEIAAHLAIESKQRTENGETAAEAERAALRVFGNRRPGKRKHAEHVGFRVVRAMHARRKLRVENAS